MRLSILFLVFATLFSASAFADDSAQIGPGIGDTAPEFIAMSDAGEAMSFDDVSGENGVALVFYRSADWCPFCQKQLVSLNEIDETTANAGWPLVGVSYDDPATLLEFASKRDLTFELVSDTDSAMIKAYGLLNEDYAPGSRAYGIPHPAIVFVSKDGIVRHVLREEGYRSRPEQELILETVSALNASE